MNNPASATQRFKYLEIRRLASALEELDLCRERSVTGCVLLPTVPPVAAACSYGKGRRGTVLGPENLSKRGSESPPV